MTQDDAKTKLCPLSLTRLDIAHSLPCCASECMAWRWVEVYVPPVWKVGDRYPSTEAKILASDTDGYCGMAGSP
jgi:hypothetical protein